MNKALKTVLFIILLVALISTISYCSAPYDTETARIINVKKTIEADGYILRKEAVVTNTAGGVFEPAVKDGVRVTKNSSVGVAISGNLDKKLTAQLEEVNQRIDEIRQSDSIADVYASDEARIFSAMRDLSTSIRENSQKENFYLAGDDTIKLDSLLKKTYSTENITASDSLLISLEEQKITLEQKLGGIRSEVLSPMSGLFYTALDGLEGYSSEKDIALLTSSKIDDFSKILSEYTPDEKTVGKITDTYFWYLAASLPDKDSSRLKPGDKITVSINESPFVSASVLAVNPDEVSGYSSVIIKSNKHISGIYEKRATPFEICLKEYSGLYVPSAAIRVVDGITGVYVMNKNNSVSFRCINVLAEEDDYYIVSKNYTPPENSSLSALKVYDKILVNPEVTRINGQS